MKRVVSSVFLTSFCFLSLFAQDGWNLERDKNGVQVYTRKTQTSNMKDSRAIALLNSDTKEVLNLLLDFENHWKWMDRIKISRTLKKISDNEFYVYYEALAPWPVSNRDLVTKYKIKLSPDGKVTLESVAQPNYIPAKDGIVRIPESTSSWEIIPLPNNKVQVIFTNHSNPGGSIPDWLANISATDNPLNTLLNLKQQVEK